MWLWHRTSPAHRWIPEGKCQCWRRETPSKRWKGDALLPYLILRCGTPFRPVQELEYQQVRRVEARNRDIVKIFISFNNMAANQGPQLIHRNPEFLGRFVLGVLRFGRW